MRIQNPLGIGLMALATGLATPALAQSAAPAPAASATAASAPADAPEIVVTANKRSERLQDAALAVTAFSGDRLADLGVQNFADYASLIPNVNLQGGVAPGVGTVVIRGLSNGNSQTTATTAEYIGETPFTANAFVSLSALLNIDPDLVDVERVEVLKGPQGTLYGASSLGGLIRIIPRDPDTHAVSGDIRVDGSTIDGGNSGGGIHASINVPLSDSIAIRVGGFAKYDPGFTTNLGTGHRNLGNSDVDGGSAAIKFKVTPDWDIKVSGLYEYSNTHGLTQEETLPGTGTLAYGKRTYSDAIDGGSTSKYWLIEGTTNYRTELGTLTATVSHAHYSVSLLEDYTDSYGTLEQILGLGAVLPAGFNVATTATPTANKTTAEARFASKRLGPVEFIAGFFFTDEHTQYPIAIQNQSPAGTPVAIPGFEYVATLNTLNSYREYAGYGDITYYLADNLDVTGGLRYSSNSQVVQAVSPPGGIINLGNYSLAFSDHSTLFMGSVRWRPSKDVSVYARVSKGYRPGGPQPTGVTPPGIPQTVKADDTISYEGGVKGKLLDRHLTYDLSVYHIDWKNIQLNTIIGGVTYIGNGGGATVDGSELQIDWSDPSGFKFGATAGYDDAKIKSIDAQTSSAIGAMAGDRLPASSRWNASGYAEFHHALSADVTGSLGATLRYQGDKVSSFPGAPIDLNYRIPGYTTLDLRTGIVWKTYSLDFRVSNVTNVNGITGYSVPGVAPGLGTLGRAYLIQPRTFAVSASAKF